MRDFFGGLFCDVISGFFEKQKGGSPGISAWDFFLVNNNIKNFEKNLVPALEQFVRPEIVFSLG